MLSQFLRGANKVEMVRTREDMLLVEECEEEGEEKREGEEEGWCPFARLEEHNLEWVIQVNYWKNDKKRGRTQNVYSSSHPKWTHPKSSFLVSKNRI